MRKSPLLTSAQVTCDSNGNGSCYLGPNTYGLSWEIHLKQVSNDSAVNQSTCFLYLNSVMPSSQIGGTWSGNMDSDSDTLTLQCGDQLWAVWSGADSGSHSMLLLSGVVTDVR